jgi:hypothetical protein
MKAENAEPLAFWFLRSPAFRNTLDEIVATGDYPWAETFRDHLERNRLVLRTLLLTRDDFFAHVSDARGMSEELRQVYSTIEIPDMVWFIEVSIPEIFGSKLRLGEVIVNAGYPAHMMREGSEPVIMIHAPGFVWTPQPGAIDPLIGQLVEDDACQVLER